MAKAHGSFEQLSWDEQTVEEFDDGAKLTHAAVTQKFSGDVEGDGAVQWLMSYGEDGSAHFVGLQRVTGTLGGRDGRFVLEVVGDFDGEVATWRATVVPGSATGGLAGLSGEATFSAPHGSTATFNLDYDLA